MARTRVTSAVVGMAALALVGTACGSSSTSASPATSSATTAGGATTIAPTTSTPTSSSLSPATSAGGGTQASAPGITASTITIGQLADVSGPVPGLFQGAVDGMDAWAALVNSTGGIDGRKVVVKHSDSALSCNVYTNGLKSLVGSTFASVGTYSLVDNCGQSILQANPTFPDIESVVLTPTIANMANVYGMIPATSGYATTGYQYVTDTYGMAAVQHAADLYSSAAATDFKVQAPAAEAAGFKYIYTRGIGNTETNYTSDILRMKSDGVKVVDVIDISVEDLADFLQQAAQQSFKPDAVITTDGYDNTLFKLLGNPALAAPVVLPLYYSLYQGQDASSVPEITTMTTWLHKTHPADAINLFSMEGFATGLLFQQLMSQLGPNPTRQGLLAAIQKVTAFTANGLVSPANVGQKKGQVCYVIAKPEKSTFVRVTPASGYTCNGKFVYTNP